MALAAGHEECSEEQLTHIWGALHDTIDAGKRPEAFDFSRLQHACTVECSFDWYLVYA